MTDPAALRASARRGEWRGTTAGQCPEYQQANLVVLTADVAGEFASFCTRNPKPCPLIEITAPGEHAPRIAAPDADLRTDLPSYRVYRNGLMTETCADLMGIWRDDFVAFLLGCSFTLEHAFAEAGVPLRHARRGTTVPMFVSHLRCVSAGRFEGPIVVTMRPIPSEQLSLVLELSARYPHAHGSPVHVGDPKAIGIQDLNRPDFGQPVQIYSGEIPVFWACGVTPQAVARESSLQIMVTHEPGQMFVTDLPREVNAGVLTVR